MAQKRQTDGPKVPLIVNPDQRCSPAFLHAVQPMCSPSFKNSAASRKDRPQAFAVNDAAASRSSEPRRMPEGLKDVFGADLLKSHCDGAAQLVCRRAEDKCSIIVSSSGQKIRMTMPACEAKGAEGFGAYTGDEGLLSASVMQGASTVVTAWLDAPAFCSTDGSEPAAQSPFSGPLLMLQGLDTVRKGQWAKFGVIRLKNGELCVASAIKGRSVVDEAYGRSLGTASNGGVWLQAKLFVEHIGTRIRFASSLVCVPSTPVHAHDVAMLRSRA